MLREDLPPVEVEEALLVGSDLIHVQVRVARILETLQHLEMSVRVRPARDHLVEVIGRDNVDATRSNTT